MFTGLVQAIGCIERVEPRERGVRLVVDAAGLAPVAGPGGPSVPLKVGDSICVSGCCLTATALDGGRFHADVSAETLDRTVHLDRRGEVNLEASLALGDRLGGHLVFGHVDGVGTVVSFDPVGESRALVLLAPPALAPLLAVKGSVAVDGVSLTINTVRDLPDGCEVSINLIPHTQAVTTLGRLAPGCRVNLEVDPLARYAQRILACQSALAPR
jgi:riboflavin synthase